MNRDVAEASQMVVPASKFSLFYNEAKVEVNISSNHTDLFEDVYYEIVC